MFVLWLVVTVVFIYLEVHTQAFYALFVAAGAAVAAISDLSGGSLWLQGLLFAAVTLGGWAVVRLALRRNFDRTVPVTQFLGIHSSAGGMVGQRGITVDTVADEHHPGHVLLGGERWLAVTDSTAPLPAEQPVTVVAVRGTTLLVRPAG